MNCRCCGHELDAQEQSAYVPGRAPTILITCWNAFCALRAFTFTAEDYPTMDLSHYCPDAPIDDATRQMQARVALITERMSLFGQVGADGARGDAGTEIALRSTETQEGGFTAVSDGTAPVVLPLCQMRSTPIPYGTYFSDDTDDDGDNWTPGKHDDDVSRPPFRVRR